MTRDRMRDKMARKAARKAPYARRTATHATRGGRLTPEEYALQTAYDGFRFRARTLADFLYGPQPRTGRCVALPVLPAPRFAAPGPVCRPHKHPGLGRDVPARCVR